MFFWLIAIPFFVIIAMFTLFRLPSSDLNQPEEMQDAAMAFRMAMQHDAAAKLMQEYQGNSESDMFDEGSYDLGGDTWKETILESGYLPSSFIPDTDNITTYVRCVNGLRQIASCRGAKGIYMITAATPPSGESITSRWFEQKGAQNLATQLNKYEGSFPVKQGGLVLPRKPRKEEDESDEEFAIRLNAYKETKAQYKLLKRNYYDFGNKLPRPNTVVGEVRAYPFNSESAESRVILTRMKVIEGEVHFDSELMPTDLPVGGEGSDSLDFNGEAVVFSKSSSCDEAPCACTKGTDCGTGAYCQGEICVASCTGFGADENRTCYTSCFTDSQCPEGYFCDSGLCELIPPFEPGDTVFSIANIGTMACYTYDSTNHRCTNTNQNTVFTGAKELESFTIVSKGKYKITIKGEAGWAYDFGGRCSNKHGYTCNWYSAAGGTNVVEKVLAKNAILKFIAIAGGKSSSQCPECAWGGSGIGLFFDGSPFMVAGGGNAGGYAGGGYLGGWSGNTPGVVSTESSGYSWDGTRTSFNTTYTEGANGGAASWSSYTCNPLVYGGSGYCADNTCVSTYGTAATMASCWTTNSNGTPKGPGYATVVYCGPDASSTCP